MSDGVARAARRRTLAEDALNLPNLLTMGRVVMIPLFLWLLDRGDPTSCYWAAIVFTLASLTDALDGYLARKLNVVSVLGKLLDPLADKILTGFAFIGLSILGELPWWVTIIVLIRVLSIPDDFFFAGRAVGIWISLTAAIAVIVAGLLEASEEL